MGIRSGVLSVRNTNFWTAHKTDLLEIFVHNDKSTAGVTVTYVSDLGRSTDVDILFYLWSVAVWCSDVVKCFKTFFHIGKSGWSTFIANE